MANKDVEVKIHIVKIKDLTKNESNPRKINSKKYEQLKKSLKDFPEMKKLREIIVDEDLTILAGHQRIYALEDLGYDDVEIKQAFNLTPKQKRQFIIKDNDHSGEWDTDILANEWDTTELAEWDMPDFSDAGDDKKENNSKTPNMVECPECLHEFEA